MNTIDYEIMQPLSKTIPRFAGSFHLKLSWPCVRNLSILSCCCSKKRGVYKGKAEFCDFRSHHRAPVCDILCLLEPGRFCIALTRMTSVLKLLKFGSFPVPEGLPSSTNQGLEQEILHHGYGWLGEWTASAIVLEFPVSNPVLPACGSQFLFPDGEPCFLARTWEVRRLGMTSSGAYLKPLCLMSSQGPCFLDARPGVEEHYKSSAALRRPLWRRV